MKFINMVGNCYLFYRSRIDVHMFMDITLGYRYILKNNRYSCHRIKNAKNIYKFGNISVKFSIEGD